MNKQNTTVCTYTCKHTHVHHTITLKGTCMSFPWKEMKAFKLF